MYIRDANIIIVVYDISNKDSFIQREAEDFAAEKGFLFHEVSAKTWDEIQELFNTVIFPEMTKKYKNWRLKKKKEMLNKRKKTNNVV